MNHTDRRYASIMVLLSRLVEIMFDAHRGVGKGGREKVLMPPIWFLVFPTNTQSKLASSYSWQCCWAYVRQSCAVGGRSHGTLTCLPVVPEAAYGVESRALEEPNFKNPSKGPRQRQIKLLQRMMRIGRSERWERNSAHAPNLSFKVFSINT